MDLELHEIEDIEKQILNKHTFTDSDLWSAYPSYSKISSARFDSQLDELLFKLSKPPDPQFPASPIIKKRGRKPIRPNDPVKKKTEDKDKYWLRLFRGYMKSTYSEIAKKLTNEEKEFWQVHLSSKGVPEKGNQHSSYGKKYKNYLFSNPSFMEHFRRWFFKYGEVELSKKYRPGSDLWFVFYDYASKELLSNFPAGSRSVDNKDLQKAPKDFDEAENIDFYMFTAENEAADFL